MKRRALLLLLFNLYLSSVSGAKDPAQDTWLEAATAYDQGAYSLAATHYQSLLPAFNNSAALHHNLGNCFYRLGEIPRAILHYERALKWRPGARATRANLAVARAQIEERVIPLPGFFLNRWVRQASWIFTPAVWGVLSLVALWSGIILLVRRMLHRPLVWHRPLLIAAITLWMASGGLGLVRLHDMRVDNAGVVMPGSMQLLAAPDAQSAEIRSVPGGEKVQILDSLDTFYKVRLLNYEEGWLPAEAIERI